MQYQRNLGRISSEISSPVTRCRRCPRYQHQWIMSPLVNYVPLVYALPSLAERGVATRDYMRFQGGRTNSARDMWTPPWYEDFPHIIWASHTLCRECGLRDYRMLQPWQLTNWQHFMHGARRYVHGNGLPNSIKWGWGGGRSLYLYVYKAWIVNGLP